MQIPRPPSVDHGVLSFVWAFALAVYIWAFMLAVGVSGWTSAIVGFVAGFAIFLYVRLYGEEAVVRRARSRQRAR
jgi:hypothetical protein